MFGDFNKGVLPGEAWKFVAVSDPALIEGLEEAREAYDRHEPAFQEQAAAYQRAHCIPRHPVPSPHAKALQEAEAAVAEALEGMIVEGEVVYAGWKAGALDGDPVAIPIELLGARRPRGSKLSVRGVQFFDVRLYPAEAIRGPGRPPGRTRAPRDADDRLRHWLAELDHDDLTIAQITAEITAAHPEVLAWWAKSTALKRVGALLPVRANDFRP